MCGRRVQKIRGWAVACSVPAARLLHPQSKPLEGKELYCGCGVVEAWGLCQEMPWRCSRAMANSMGVAAPGIAEAWPRDLAAAVATISLGPSHPPPPMPPPHREYDANPAGPL